MTMDEIIRRLTALERRVPESTGGIAGSPGQSSAFGATSTNYRDRFPVILTSEFDSSTGYSWARIILDRSLSSPSVVEIDTPQIGDYAFTPDNDETLQVGERGWLEADPNAGGWFFIKSKPSLGSAGGCGHINPGMDTDTCLKVTVVSAFGLCSTIDTAQEVYLAWDAGDSRWEAAAAFDHTGSGTDPGAVNFGFTNGVPYMTIAGVYGTLQGCDDGGLLFSFGTPVLCAGGTDTQCENYFVVRVECSCCPITGWDGEGWYCVVAAGDTCGVDQQYCVELLDADKCDTDIEICSGPYASESSCMGSCTGAVGGVVVSCCTSPIPETLNWAITNKVGVCSCAPDNGTVTYNAVTEDWEFVTFACPLFECEENASYPLECVGGTWYFNSTAASSVTCPENGTLSIVFNISPTFGGSYTITFTA